MNNQSGSAIIMVLLFLGVVSILGAGLMIQSKMDIQFNSAVKSADTRLDLADGAAAMSIRNLPLDYSGAFNSPTVVTDTTSNVEQWAGGGYYKYRYIIVDHAPAKQCAGFNITGSTAGHYVSARPLYWTAEGIGRSGGGQWKEAKGTVHSGVGGRSTETTVQIPCVRCPPVQ